MPVRTNPGSVEATGSSRGGKPFRPHRGETARRIVHRQLRAQALSPPSCRGGRRTDEGGPRLSSICGRRTGGGRCHEPGDAPRRSSHCPAVLSLDQRELVAGGRAEAVSDLPTVPQRAARDRRARRPVVWPILALEYVPGAGWRSQRGPPILLCRWWHGLRCKLLWSGCGGGGASNRLCTLVTGSVPTRRRPPPVCSGWSMASSWPCYSSSSYQEIRPSV